MCADKADPAVAAGGGDADAFVAVQDAFSVAASGHGRERGFVACDGEPNVANVAVFGANKGDV